MNNNVELGKKIKEVRLSIKMSQKAMAEKLGKTTRTVQKYETGEIDITLQQISEIADILGTSVKRLIGEDQEVEINTLSDVYNALAQIDEKIGICFDVDTEKLNDKILSCKVIFKNDPDHKYNNEICSFLAEYALKKAEREAHLETQAGYLYWLRNASEEAKAIELVQRKDTPLSNDERLARLLAAYTEKTK